MPDQFCKVCCFINAPEMVTWLVTRHLWITAFAGKVVSYVTGVSFFFLFNSSANRQNRRISILKLHQNVILNHLKLPCFWVKSTRIIFLKKKHTKKTVFVSNFIIRLIHKFLSTKFNSWWQLLIGLFASILDRVFMNSVFLCKERAIASRKLFDRA